MNRYQRRALPIFTAIALACVCIVTWRFTVLHSPQEEVSIKTTPPKEDGVLFQELVDVGLIFQATEKWGPNTQLLEYAQSDRIEAHEAQLAVASSDDHARNLKRNIELLRELHYSTVGLAVRKAISTWNSSHIFAAVRDNRPLPKQYEIETSPENTLSAPSTTGLKNINQTTAWQATDLRYPALHARTANSVPDYCIFVAGGVMRGGFNDWQRFLENEPLRLKSSIDLDEPTTITVQVIGTVDDIFPEPKVIIPRYANDKPFNNLAMPTENDAETASELVRDEKDMAAQLSEKSAEKSEQKDSGKDSNDAPKNNEAMDTALGYEIVFELPKGNTDIRFTLNPVAFAIDQIAGQHIRFDRNCEFSEAISWINFQNQTMWQEPSPSAITTSDGVVLNNKEGLATKDTWDFGLSALTGLSPNDTNTLEWIFSNSLEPNDVILTIDAALQRTAVDCLHKGVEALENDTPSRRASLVVMNADTGAILAATSYPQISSDLNWWDIRAFERYYNSQNIRTFKPFKGVNASSAPGSILKPLIGLAAYQYVADKMEGSSAVESYLKGYTPEEFTEKSGMSFDIIAYNPITHEEYVKDILPNGHWRITPEIKNSKGLIKNFNNKPLSHLLYKSQTFGLREAIKTSANLYFVRLGEMLDPQKEAEAYDFDPTNMPWPNFYLGEYAKQFGFDGEFLDLLANVPEAQGAQRTQPSRYGEGDVMYAAPSSLRIQEGKHNVSAQLEMAQNTIGQAVTTTPLQMARMFAAIATGMLPTPALIAEFNGVKTPPLPAKAIERDNHLQLLIDGMHDVVNTVNGTAYSAFKDCPVQSYMYGKTGTANIQGITVANRQANNSAWFAGWLEPVQDGDPRLAIVVFVSHTDKTGGRVAAPIAADFLTRIAKQEPTQ